MAYVSRKAMMASSAAVALAAVVAMAWIAAPATALVPYERLWDLLDDPFRVLEQSPVALPSSVPRPGGGEAGSGVALARCDWKETPEAHVISVDVPGVRREDVKVEVEESSRVLRVSGERRRSRAEEGRKDDDGEPRWHRAERAAGRFWRRFRMPAGADVDRVSARLDSGVLTVTVPKVAEHRRREPRVISIAADGDGDGRGGGAEATTEVKASKAAEM